MISTFFRRSILTHKSYIPYGRQFANKASFLQEQIPETDYFENLKQAIQNHNQNWSEIKQSLLKSPGNLNHKNVDAIMLKLMVNNKILDTAQSFANYLQNEDSLTLGSTNGLLGLYYEIGKTRKLSDAERQFILDTYKILYDKYKILDSTTSEKLLHALCVIDETKKALRVLDEIHYSGVPSHSAYSTLVATLFRINKKAEALALIQRGLNDKRPILYVAYEQWINYIMRKYKTNSTIIKYLDEICVHIARNCLTLDVDTSKKLAETYSSLGWKAQFSTISRHSGLCECCNETLKCLKVTSDEFQELQKNVKEKLIVGSDLFLKTSPEELQRFLSFVEKTAPYDIVLDGLNIALAVGSPDNRLRATFLKAVVDHFKRQNKKILLLGRKHMLKWPKQPLEYLKNNTSYFFTDNLSQDDPYFITAAILSGPHTDIVSKDLLRGHMFNLKHEDLRHIFRRWQWQHQWMVFASRGRPQIMAPVKFTPFAQRADAGWHLPYDKEDPRSTGQVNLGLPNLTNWLCLKSNVVSK
ncbi:mitochondrial ribonuclease P catalytic subunit isoform X1 [Cydia amplana]|uniref:mitochondrial ribonuclease P catalytic subunit isoform X1 n=1 Tax=Cydia amplana TaxID=1869771 RepID=UPI002FE52414